MARKSQCLWLSGPPKVLYQNDLSHHNKKETSLLYIPKLREKFRCQSWLCSRSTLVVPSHDGADMQVY
jgi:hypothetical protein